MSQTAVAPADPSPMDAAGDAFEHTRRLLFPFQFDRWLTLGFVAFLDQCGRGGVGGTMPGGPGFPGGGGGGTGGGSGAGGGLSDLGAWFTAHLGLIVAVAAGVLVVVVLLAALVLWIGSRATFVYLEDVATGRAELSRPWRDHAERAQSYFAWRFGLAAALLGAVALLVVVAVGAFFLMARGGRGGMVLGGILLVALVPTLILILLAGGLSAMALRDFVAPLQVHSGLACGPAVRLFLSLLRLHPLAFVLYVLLKVVFGLVQGVVLLAAACLTCCCVLIPVVTQTALQPLFFFERAWSLYLLRRMGYDVLATLMPAEPASV